MNKNLTKTQVTAMTTEELQEMRAQLVAAILPETSKKDKNLMNGSIGLIDVELAGRKPVIEADPQGEGSIETVVVNPADTAMHIYDDANDHQEKTADEEQQELDETPSIKPTPSALAGVLTNIRDIYYTEMPDNEKLARIMKAAENNVDYTNLPYELCTDAELMRRLKLLWSKRVAAKKTADFATLNEIDEQEALINSFRNAKTTRTGTVASDNVDHSKLSQIDLQKLIRNYQSKKSNAKKLYEAAVKDNAEQTVIDEHKGLMEHWQAKVDDASKYRTGGNATTARSAELTKQIQDTLVMLKSLPQSDEIAAKIQQLEALV